MRETGKQSISTRARIRILYTQLTLTVWNARARYFYEQAWHGSPNFTACVVCHLVDNCHYTVCDGSIHTQPRHSLNTPKNSCKHNILVGTFSHSHASYWQYIQNVYTNFEGAFLPHALTTLALLANTRFTSCFMYKNKVYRVYFEAHTLYNTQLCIYTERYNGFVSDGGGEERLTPPFLVYMDIFSQCILFFSSFSYDRNSVNTPTQMRNTIHTYKNY